MKVTMDTISVSHLMSPLVRGIRERSGITGFWCPVCHTPRTPYPGDEGVHPLCWKKGRQTGLIPKTPTTAQRRESSEGKKHEPQ